MVSCPFCVAHVAGGHLQQLRGRGLAHATSAVNVVDQAPFAGSRRVDAHPSTFYIVPMDPPILVQYDNDHLDSPTPRFVRIEFLYKSWDSCVYNFEFNYDTPTHVDRYVEDLEFLDGRKSYRIPQDPDMGVYAYIKTSDVGATAAGRARNITRAYVPTSTGRHRLVQQGALNSVSTYEQDPFTDDTDVYGPDAYYEVSVDPPVVVPVVVGDDEAAGGGPSLLHCYIYARSTMSGVQLRK
jgi:hypothetical protein